MSGTLRVQKVRPANAEAARWVSLEASSTAILTAEFRIKTRNGEDMAKKRFCL
jgi:hypothetical protein